MLESLAAVVCFIELFEIPQFISLILHVSVLSHPEQCWLQMQSKIIHRKVLWNCTLLLWISDTFFVISFSLSIHFLKLFPSFYYYFILSTTSFSITLPSLSWITHYYLLFFLILYFPLFIAVFSSSSNSCFLIFLFYFLLLLLASCFHFN